jgi:peptidoglycan/LPS O-acetylase OafA/YrhL
LTASLIQFMPTALAKKPAHTAFSSASPVPPLDTELPPYFPEVDGLRAVAVLLVVFCHAQLFALSGGFIGVDVFFTISGYVVMLASLRRQKRGDFSLGRFYQRRLQRLAPSVLLVLAATLVFCACFCFPEDAFAVLKNALLATVFYSNIYLSKQTGYFDPGADKQALLHTWSLSVEEQFYLLLPLLLLVLRRLRKLPLVLTLAALLAATLAFSQYAVEVGTPQAYYKLQYRAFEFLIGTLLAVAHYHGLLRGPMRERASAWTLAHELALLAGLSLIAYASLSYSASTVMPGFRALVPCAGAALVIAGARGARHASRLLANRPAVYLGKLSYGIYLWHWPILFALRRLQLHTTGWVAAGMVLSLIFSIMTYHLWEQPLRYARWSQRKTFTVLMAVPISVMGLILLAATKTDNFVSLYPSALRQNYIDTGHSLFDLPRAKDCWSKVAVTSPAQCSLGDTSIPLNAVYWGDSHAYHQIEFVDRLGKDFHLHLHDVALTMCPPNENGPARAGDAFYQHYRDDCLAHNRQVMAYILSQPAIKTVVMSAVWQNYENRDTGPSPHPTTHGYLPGDSYLADTLAKLAAAGKRLIFLDDIPIVPPELENCAANKFYLPFSEKTDCSYAASYATEQHRPAARILTEMAQRFPGVEIIHTFDVPCEGDRCATELMGTPLYRNNDTGHLGLGGSRVYYDVYRRKYPQELQRVFH